MALQKAPVGLAAGGRKLWAAIRRDHGDLDPTQCVQLEEACRAKDRLDKLDLLLRGDISAWADIELDHDGRPVSLRIDSALNQANATANLMKQLLAALRLPDPVTGKKPQYRGPRGAQVPSIPGGADEATASSRAKQRWGA